jgi:hypothetical protein
MSKNSKIYVKLQVEKDQDSGELVIKTYFDPDAPNFYQDKKEVSWIPTSEEIEFINEAFELIPPYKSKGGHFGNVSKKNKKDETPVKLEETDKDATNEQDEMKETDSETKGNEEEILISSDSGKIDRILDKKKDPIEGDVLVEADEDEILDKVLKQKKKKIW